MLDWWGDFLPSPRDACSPLIFTDEQAMNLVGEIAGSDLKDEVVIIGAHLDTWHASPNASDNQPGVAVALGATPIMIGGCAEAATPMRLGLRAWAATGACCRREVG